jgi:hypothetical protein
MEKAVVFGPLVLFFGFFLLLIILFIGFIVKLVLKSKNEDWSGEVIDKKVNEVEDFDTGSKSDHYFLVVKMDTGKTRNIGLSRQLWENFQTGDKLHKPKGKLFPDKV